MSHRPFRFVHASDFHLEMPPHGLAEVPEHLREPLIEAAYAAATRVFDAVLAEEAEFLVLSGDILHAPQTGPRGPLFLCEQFARLAQRQIPVYWAVGGVDPPEVWPAFIPVPDNVHLSARGRVAELIHQRDAAPLARVLLHGRDGNRLVRAGDFNPDPAGLYSIAVVHGTVETAGAGRAGDRLLGPGRAARPQHAALRAADGPLRRQPARPAARGGGRPRLHARSSSTRTARPRTICCPPMRSAGSTSGWSSTRTPAAATWNRCCASGAAPWRRPRRRSICWSPGPWPAAGR